MGAGELIREPASSTLPRRPGSARRTSHVDMVPVDGGGLELVGAARDLVTDAAGATTTVAEATVTARLGADRLLARLDLAPAAAGVEQLLGRPVAGGFRAAVDAAVPAHREARSPTYLLLDELPVAALISGYATLYARTEPVAQPTTAGAAPRRVMSDLCAGWRSDGTMMTALAEQGSFPAPVGPPLTPLDVEDPLAWHAIGALGPGAMRRRRLVDVAVGPTLDVYAMFRDTHVDPDGVETVLHEYHVDVTVDAETMVIGRSTATPHVLPWIECPGAVGSAGRLVGHPVTEVRDIVRQDFRGITTCTHLNDLLRSLGDVAAIASLV